MVWSFSHLRTAALALVLAGVQTAVSQPRAPVWQWESVAGGLQHPWALGFLPDGSYLITERVGQLRRVHADGRMDAPIDPQLSLAVGGQGGLLDLALDQAFAKNRHLYLCYAESGAGGSATALARVTLSPDHRRVSDVRVLFRQSPRVNSTLHFGCRIVLAAPDLLFLSLGERGTHMQHAQRLDNHMGKVVRLHTDGRIPQDNPFVQTPGAKAEIWSLGHRNPQGASLAPDGRLWMHEHGPQGGDEINLIQAAVNYGWPVVTHGENYGGGPIGKGQSSQPGMQSPVHHWTPSIAPSGMSFLSSTRYGTDMQGQLFVGSLKFGQLVRMQWQGQTWVERERIAVGERVRDVRQGPDGLLYLLTDSPRGQLLRLVRR